MNITLPGFHKLRIFSTTADKQGPIEMQHWLFVGSSQVQSAPFNGGLARFTAEKFLRLWLSSWMVLAEADNPLRPGERSYTFTENREPTESQLLKLEPKNMVL